MEESSAPVSYAPAGGSATDSFASPEPPLVHIPRFARTAAQRRVWYFLQFESDWFPIAEWPEHFQFKMLDFHRSFWDRTVMFNWLVGNGLGAGNAVQWLLARDATVEGLFHSNPDRSHLTQFSALVKNSQKPDYFHGAWPMYDLIERRVRNF